MKYFYLNILFSLSICSISAQKIGINTTTPHAQLEIKSSNEAAPAITDGLLIPKIDVFPALNPTVAQQGMMVYLTTDVGANMSGFYYWNFGTLTWVSIGNNNATTWNFSGNAGTNAATNFIGTTDNADLNFRINNIKAGVLSGNRTAFGLNTLKNNTTGFDNVAFGKDALSSNTSGYLNTATGVLALSNNTVGNSNTANGHRALKANTEGNDNTANGYNALANNDSGSGNVASGSGALNSNSTGNYNTAVGSSALSANTTGDKNTAVGTVSLRYNSTGQRNVAMGDSALLFNTTGYDNTANGYAALFTNVLGYYNTANGAYALYSNTDGNSNTATGVLSLNTNSTGSDNTANGISALSANTTGSSNTAHGAYSLILNTTGSFNTAIGRLSLLSNSTGSEISSLGAFTNVSSSNLTNATVIGARATVGTSNSLILGSIAGVNGATSSVNVGIGTSIPLDKLHVVGSIRMVDGNQAAGKIMVSNANGTASWQTNSSTNAWGLIGNASTSPTTNFIGTTDNNSLAFKTNNVERVRILETGNFGIGTSTPGRLLHLENNSTSTTAGQLYLNQSGSGDALMHIGTKGGRHYNLGLDASEGSFKIGTSSSTATTVTTGTLMTLLPTGEVGIGTTSPQEKLHVSGPAGLTTIRIANTSTGGSTSNVSLDFLRQGNDNTDWRVYNIGPNLTIGNSGDDFANVNDLYQFQGSRFTPMNDNAQNLGQSTARWNTLFASNGTISTSDAREKKNIQNLNYGLNDLMKLRPVSFEWKKDDGSGRKLGLIAQELQKIIPEVVRDWDWEEDQQGNRKKVKAPILGVYYSDLIPVLIQSIQELSTENIKLKSDYQALVKRLESLEEKIR